MRAKETTRELAARWESLTFEEKKSILAMRSKLAKAKLRSRLRIGDKIRATRAECGAREASFFFAGWSGGWIMSSGGSSISPGMVYSVNGDVLVI